MGHLFQISLWDIYVKVVCEQKSVAFSILRISTKAYRLLVYEYGFIFKPFHNICNMFHIIYIIVHSKR